LTWFPVVGALLGAAVGAAWWGAEKIWPPMVAAAIAVGVDLALTGLLHVDGVIDSADGLLPHLSRERRLEVMAEPTVGAYGVAVGAAGVVLRFAAFTSAQPDIAVVAAVWCASRTVMAVATRSLPYARTEGGLATAMRGESWGPVAALGAVVAVAISALSGWRAISAVAVCAVVAGAVVLFGRRQLGGFTGDVVGAAGFTGETAALLVAAVK
jgi:cobalamin 5'-phosphate synthase/cobalamin synthase